MGERLRNILALMRGQFWIVPLIMSIVAIMAAFALLDPSLHTERSWLFSGDFETARTLMSALLTGLMTMTSLVVSITFVTLTLASNQLGPRLVLNFMGDRQIQAVIGLFIATVFYLIVILRGLDGSLASVPQLAITTGTVLIGVCLLALLFYVHKIGRAIVADTVVAEVSGHLQEQISKLPERSTKEPPAMLAGVYAPRLLSASLGEAGYVQTIDYLQLVELARKHDVTLMVLVRAGRFVLPNGQHVIVHGATAVNAPQIREAIRSNFILGSQRSPAQDLEFSIRLLVEVGLRALSPSINDPFTAIAVVDRLAAALEQIDRRDLPEEQLRDSAGTLRVVADRADIDELVQACFSQLRFAAQGHTAVLLHLSDTIGHLRHSVDHRLSASLATELERLVETAEHAQLIATDRAAIIESARAATR